MPEATRAQLKERLARLGERLLKRDMENDALTQQVRTLDIQLWEARNVIAAYRSAHIESLNQQEEE